MKIITILFLLVLSVVGFAQSLGVHDQAAAAVRPAFPPQRTEPARPSYPLFSERALAATTGTFVYKITISIKSPGLSGATLACQGNASTFDAGTRSISEQETVMAVGTGSTRSCTVTMAYSWSLTTGSADIVNLGYVIQAPTLLNSLPNRLSSQTIATLHGAPSGTTTETVSATI